MKLSIRQPFDVIAEGLVLKNGAEGTRLIMNVILAECADAADNLPVKEYCTRKNTVLIGIQHTVYKIDAILFGIRERNAVA